jgi:hypothetical protein
MPSHQPNKPGHVRSHNAADSADGRRSPQTPRIRGIGYDNETWRVGKSFMTEFISLLPTGYDPAILRKCQGTSQEFLYTVGSAKLRLSSNWVRSRVNCHGNESVESLGQKIWRASCASSGTAWVFLNLKWSDFWTRKRLCNTDESQSTNEADASRLCGSCSRTRARPAFTWKTS